MRWPEVNQNFALQNLGVAIYGSVAFSPDIKGAGSRWLVTGSGDGSTRLWALGQEGLSDPIQRSADREVARAALEQAPPEHDARTTLLGPVN
jgi:WD40 repeat protein